MDWKFLIWAGLYVILAFLLFWVFIFRLQKRISHDVATDPIPHRNLIFAQRALGFLLFGLIAGFLGYLLLNDPFSQTGIKLLRPQEVALWAVVLLSSLLIFNLFSARTKLNQQTYPQIRISRWSPSFFTLNAATWLIFLLGYEYLFRGLLFFPSVQIMGLWPAIGLNIVLYSLVHIPKGIHEILGALPFGVILCLAAYDTGSFWVAFIAHGGQAVINEFYAIRYNPEMDFGEQVGPLSKEALRSGDNSD